MESLVNLHRFTALTAEFDYSTLKLSAPTYSVESNTFAQLGSESLRYPGQLRFAETTAFHNLQQHSSMPVSVSHDHHNDVHSPPTTDLRMDWANACSLGRLPSFNRYFLLILDTGTEHWATYPSKSRGCGTPVELLKQYVLTTGRKPRYLRVDNAEEFTSQEMVDYYKDNNIILQPVVAYNHTMQARVEGAIGCSIEGPKGFSVHSSVVESAAFTKFSNP